MKLDRIIYSISVIGLAVLIIMLNIASPTEVGPFGVLLLFTTLYFVFYGIITFLVHTFIRIALKRKNMHRKDYLYSAILAFGPIMLLMARSFGAVTPWTISLIIIFLGLAEFLVYKRI